MIFVNAKPLLHDNYYAIYQISDNDTYWYKYDKYNLWSLYINDYY